MARSLRSLSGSGLTAAPTPRSILAPSMKARACHHPSRQRQPSLTCDPVSNHAPAAMVSSLERAVLDAFDDSSFLEQIRKLGLTPAPLGADAFASFWEA